MSKIKEKKSEKVNVKLLEKISEHILEEPKRVNMDIWLDEDKEVYKHKCHTVGCIAGWAVALKGSKAERQNTAYYDVSRNATRLLRISDVDADNLFISDHWPAKLRERLSKHDERTRGYAKVVAARIADFIKEKTK